MTQALTKSLQLAAKAGRGAPAADVIVGLGVTGLACARHLHGLGVSVAVTDSRAEPPGLEVLRAEIPEARVQIGGFDSRLLTACERLYVSPGVPLSDPFVTHARERGVTILGDIDLFVAAVRAPLIAVSGSNGKSTVTRMLEHVAGRCGHLAYAGGNLGTAALDLLTRPRPDAYVLELSSFQLERTASLPTLASVVLNLSADHMDRYADLAAYGAAKGRIYAHCDVAVVNRDDPMAAALAADCASVVGFGLGVPAANDFGLRADAGQEFLCRGNERLLPVVALPVLGRHNVANALATLALGESVGWRLDAMATALRSFRGLPHRTELVAEQGSVRWINDSKGTNVGATLAAIDGIAGQLVWIAGGIAKDADFSPLGDSLKGRTRAVVLIGQDAARIAAVLAADTPVVFAPDLDAAVAAARGFARPGDSVLFSPACASFDMFTGFEQRGEMFAAAVRGELA